MKPPLRTHSVGTKTGDEDFAQVEARAAERGTLVGERCREPILVSASNALGSPGEQTALTEVITLLTIMANPIYAFTGEGNVTRDQRAAFIGRADKTRLKQAADLLSQFSKNGDPQNMPQASVKEGQ